MSTTTAPIGLPVRPETNTASGRQSRTFDATPRLGGRIRIALIVGLLAVGILLVLSAHALALGQISYGGCVSSDGSGGLCAAASGFSLTGATSVAVSPDGTTVYVTAYNGRALAVLNRAATGQLTFAGCVSDDGSGGACADLPGAPLAGANSVVVSADGTSVYVSSFGSATVVAFNRAPGGQITYASCVSDDGSGGLCANPPGSLATPNGLSLSPDGTALYVAVSHGVTVLDRAPGGQLSYAGCISNNGSGGVCGTDPGPALNDMRSLAVSPDGRSLYVASSPPGAVTVFDRAAGGQITYAGCVSDDGSGGRCADVPGTPLGADAALAVSPAGNTVYATSGSTATITVFDRAAGGQITYAGCVSNTGSGGLCANAAVSPLADATGVTVSSDGESVYVSSFDGAVAVFDRLAGGQITSAGCVSNTGSGGLCADAPGNPLTAAEAVTVSPDDNSVYVAAYGAGTVTQFFRKTAPDTQIISGPAEGSVITVPNPTFAFASDQAGASFECAVDGQAFTACATPTTLGPLTDGDHRLTVRAVTGGDPDPSPASRTFSVNTSVPAIPTVTTGPGAPNGTAGGRHVTARTGPRIRILRAPRATIRTRRQSVTVRFVFAAHEPGASLRCKLDRRAFASCRSPLVYRVRRGRHTVVIEAIDPLGNAGKPTRRSFRVVPRAPRSASRHPSRPHQGGGARVAQAAREEGLTNSTTTQEVNR
jgi:DNA-binding beta-propeller fold protein YncE